MRNRAWLVALSLLVTGIVYRSSRLFNYCRHGYRREMSSLLGNVESFRSTWMRHERSRTAWHEVNAACVNQSSWQHVLPWWQREARTDPDNTYISIWDIQPAGQFSRFLLQSQYPNGTKKNTGGDWWRVKIVGPISLQTFVHDFTNGTYEVSFLPLVLGTYTVNINLEYTLCDGAKDPPTNWFSYGNTQGKEQQHGLLGNDIPFINKPLWEGAPIQINIPKALLSKRDQLKMRREACRSSPFNKCRKTWNGFGYWNNNSWVPFCNDLPVDQPRLSKDSIAKKSLLWVFGDSVAAAFYRSLRGKPLCKQIFRSCFYSYNWVYQIENYNHSLGVYVIQTAKSIKSTYNALEFNVTRVLIELHQVLQHPQMDSKSALLFNHGLHYVESVTFADFQRLINGMVGLLKSSGYNGTAIWRSTTAMSREKYSVPYIHSRRFLNSQRLLLYNRFALDMFCRAGVEILDVYPLTTSYPHGTGSRNSPYDPVHYENHVLEPVEKVLERRFAG